MKASTCPQAQVMICRLEYLNRVINITGQLAVYKTLVVASLTGIKPILWPLTLLKQLNQND